VSWPEQAAPDIAAAGGYAGRRDPIEIIERPCNVTCAGVYEGQESTPLPASGRCLTHSGSGAAASEGVSDAEDRPRIPVATPASSAH
jgi:hypothetical protein